jgi:hypothetical protein
MSKETVRITVKGHRPVTFTVGDVEEYKGEAQQYVRKVRGANAEITRLSLAQASLRWGGVTLIGLFVGALWAIWAGTPAGDVVSVLKVIGATLAAHGGYIGCRYLRSR